MTDAIVDCEVPSEAPPSYAEHAPICDSKGDEKAKHQSDAASQPAAASSSSQLVAPPTGARIMDQTTVTKNHNASWPVNARPRRVDAIYGLYMETKDMYGEPHTLKITDYNGGILYHFLFPHRLWGPKRLKQHGHVFMLPGDQTIPNPRGHWREGPEHPFKTGPSPPTPDAYTWRVSLGCQRIECVDGRVLPCDWSVWNDERQVYIGECLYTRRDQIEFTVPAAKNASSEGQASRTFVWLCTTIPRNQGNHRWDEARYVLHEKGDFTCQYAYFNWRKAFSIGMCELPDELQREHPLLFFTLGYLILLQMGMCARWPPSSYEASGFSKDTTRLSFSVAALQQEAAKYGIGPQKSAAPTSPSVSPSSKPEKTTAI